MSRKENFEIISFAERLRNKHKKIIVILSPPRCASTALARFFWHQPDFRYYAHEPYETVYYEGDTSDTAQGHLLNPIDLVEMYSSQPKGNGLIIKEMPYQVSQYFSDLISLATLPLIFLIRDPRLNIKSRIDKRIQAKQSIDFPFIETGWELINWQIEQCVIRGVDFVIVEASEMRNNPNEIFSNLSHKLKLPFSPEMLRWQQALQINLDNLNSKHSHLYERVLSSIGIEPAIEPIPNIETFSTESGLRNHVLEALNIYNKLLTHPKRLDVNKKQA